MDEDGQPSKRSRRKDAQAHLAQFGQLWCDLCNQLVDNMGRSAFYKWHGTKAGQCSGPPAGVFSAVHISA